MIDSSDRDLLVNRQYRDASNFNARIALHQRFSTNPYFTFIRGQEHP